MVTAGGLDDGIPPMPIIGTTAIDVPNDEGGRINVGFKANTEEDCTYYAGMLYLHLVGNHLRQ